MSGDDFKVINMKKFTEIFEKCDFLYDTAEQFVERAKISEDDEEKVNFPLVAKRIGVIF